MRGGNKEEEAGFFKQLLKTQPGSALNNCRCNITGSHLLFLSSHPSSDLPLPPSGLSNLVNGNLVCGCCIVLGEWWALVGFCRLSGAAHW